MREGGLAVTRVSSLVLFDERRGTYSYDVAVIDLSLSPDLSPVERALERSPGVRVAALRIRVFVNVLQTPAARAVRPRRSLQELAVTGGGGYSWREESTR